MHVQSSLNPQTTEHVSIRLSSASDIPFIYSVWLRSYRYDSPHCENISNGLFFESHKNVLARILAHRETRVVVACHREDPDLLFGFMAYGPGVIHFIYVKRPFRNMGIARMLVESQQIDHDSCQTSHLTYSLIDMWRGGVTRIKYNRNLIGDSDERDSE